MFSVEQLAVIGAILDFRHSLPAFVSLRHRGTHQLKDLARPERVHELLHPDLPGDFPPIKSLSTLGWPQVLHIERGAAPQESLAKWRK